MKKILLAINGSQINQVTIDFACYIATLTKSKLTALFLRDNLFELIPPREVKGSYQKRRHDGVIEIDTVHPDADKEVRYFIDACERRGITADVLVRGEANGDHGSPVDEAVNESRFTDLLILDAETSFGKKTETLPTHFVKEVASRSECPVLIAPGKFDGIDEIIFCYDGGGSSVFAMKQFTYLFPQWAKAKLIILEIDDKKNSVTQKEKISNWLQAHYEDFDFQKLNGDASEGLLSYFLMKERRLIVMGAYGRSHISNFFRKSSANLLIRVVDLPLFISHQ